MSENPPISLHSVSVVVTAQFHNPSILNPDFLESREIVPADWTVADSTVDGAVDDSAITMVSRIIAAPQFATAWVAGSVDSSTDDSSTSLVKRIIAAKQHDEIIKVLPLLELHTIATRLDYLRPNVHFSGNALNVGD